MIKNLLLLAACLQVSAMLQGAVRLPAVFSDHMVLQCGMRLPVWGWADPGEKVTVTCCGQKVTVITPSTGKWMLYLEPVNAGGPFEMLVEASNHLVVRDILAGEVWICSGQSNMAMELGECQDAAAEIRAAQYPEIRHFQVKRFKALHPLEDVSPVTDPASAWLNTWEVCSPSTAGHFTGAGYFFARDLHLNFNVPVGIIHASWGGTTAEAWTPADTLHSDPWLRYILQNWPDYNNDEEWLRDEYARFIREAEEARNLSKPEPLYFNQPSVLYNGIIAPLVPYAIKGVAWYQGESNAYRAAQYRVLLPALIRQWRNQWKQGPFPFLIVQLANYSFEPQVFPELREAQAYALGTPNTALAVSIDIGEAGDIHPKNKQAVGHRLYLSAAKTAYGMDIPATGPVFRRLTIYGNRCLISFDHSGGGLCTPQHQNPGAFEIAGADKKYYPAEAHIEGDSIWVGSPEVPVPVAVRYAWSNQPHGALLYNSIDNLPYLPAVPFRTDYWPGLTDTRY